MRLTRLIAPTATVLIVSLSSAIAFASPSPSHLHMAQNTESDQSPGEQFWDKLTQDLNLKQDQVQKIQAIRNQYKDKTAQPRQALKQADQELQALMATTASEDEIREKYLQVENLKQQVQSLQFDQMLAIREVLTPEQRSQAAELIQKTQQKLTERFKQP